MLSPISKSRFKARALEIFRQIETSGESVVITDNGVPKLEVRLYRCRSDRPLDLLRGSLLHYDRPVLPVDENDWEVLK